MASCSPPYTTRNMFISDRFFPQKNFHKNFSKKWRIIQTVNYFIGKFTFLTNYTDGMGIRWKPKFPKTKDDNPSHLNHLVFFFCVLLPLLPHFRRWRIPHHKTFTDSIPHPNYFVAVTPSWWRQSRRRGLSHCHSWRQICCVASILVAQSRLLSIPTFIHSQPSPYAYVCCRPERFFFLSLYLCVCIYPFPSLCLCFFSKQSNALLLNLLLGVLINDGFVCDEFVYRFSFSSVLFFIR